MLKLVNNVFVDADNNPATDLSFMFDEVDADKIPDLTNLDLSNVTDISGMFARSEFNQDISKWDTSSVEDMRYMFYGSAFNQDISEWDTSRVEVMRHMFYGSAFNQDISKWNTSSVTNMGYMFTYSGFNGDISKWVFNDVVDREYMFNNPEWVIDTECGDKNRIIYKANGADLFATGCFTGTLKELTDRIIAKYGTVDKYSTVLADLLAK